MKQRTVIEEIIAQCEKAYLSGKPIIVLRTNELSLVRRVIESDKLVVRLSKDCSNGVDQVTVIPTRYLPEKQNLQLFRKTDANKDLINFNIHYISHDQLQSFALKDSVNYGMPEMTVKYDFPSLYVIQYRYDASKPLVMWDNADLNAFIDRHLQESLSGSALSSSVILLYGESAVVPPKYENYCEIIDEPYPENEEIVQCLIDSQVFDAEKERSKINTISDALMGLPLLQVERIIRSLSIIPHPIHPKEGCILQDEKQAVDAVQKQKEQLLKTNSLLELVRVDSQVEDITGDTAAIGGMKNFRDWISVQKKSIKEGDRLKRDVGAVPPKGVLLCGVPGCGKSMAVDSVAATLKIPLLKMDIGQLMGKYVGESEHNMMKALKTAEAMAPCVLFIDELDKGFSSAGKGSDDSGPFKRMFGTLLGWMQNCKKPCFIFATANDISKLPKEFFRSGRFDCLYSLYMPTSEECVSIFKKQMVAAEKNAGRALFDDDCLASDNLVGLVNGFVSDSEKPRYVTGADIQKLVSMALRDIWTSGYTPGELIGWTKWRKCILKALEVTSVYGDSKENLDSIAMCYIRLLRSNFVPASGSPLFRAEDYVVEEVKPEEDAPKQGFPAYRVTIKEGKKVLSEYDQSFRRAIVPLIEKYGSLVEEHAVRSMLV